MSMYKRTIFLAIALLLQLTVSAQQEQLWLDYQLAYPFANRFLLENTTSYQTLLNKNDKWRSLALSPNFEYTIFTQLDLLFEVPLAYTVQKEGTSSFEISPITGARFYLTQNRRLDLRLVLRYQIRAFRQIEDEDWDVSNRTRLRGEIYFCMNGPNMFTDKLWYLFGDYEEFIVLDQQVQERYANRRRTRIGLGYRLSYQHRFDASYTLQTSRNEIDSDFVNNDNIIQLRYKMYLNPKRVTDSD